MKYFFFCTVLLITTFSSCRLKEGCTDPSATNYDSEARKDCQCCTYNTTPKRFEGKLNLMFNTRYFITSYIIGDTLTDPKNGKFIIDNLVFYLSNISLIDIFNNEKKLRDVELFRFNATNSVTVSFDSIPAGNYTGIKFGVGVDSIYNNQTPSSYPLGHPLANTTYYWGAKNYIFTQLKGRADTSGTLNYNLSLDYNVGTDSLYRKVEINNTAILIKKDETTEYKLNLNLEKLFYGKNDTINYKINSQTQTNLGDPVARIWANNFMECFSE